MANKEVAVQEEKKDVNILRKNKKDIQRKDLYFYHKAGKELEK